MKEIKTLLNLLINYIVKVYKIILLIKLNMNLFVIFLLSILMKTKTNLFHKYEYKNKIKLFQS